MIAEAVHSLMREQKRVMWENLPAPTKKLEVKCIYIDPPYNTKSAFEHYDDGHFGCSTPAPGVHRVTAGGNSGGYRKPPAVGFEKNSRGNQIGNPSVHAPLTFLGQGLPGGVHGFDLDAVLPGIIDCGFARGIAGADVFEPVLLALGERSIICPGHVATPVSEGLTGCPLG
jgi:hypothetical protein